VLRRVNELTRDGLWPAKRLPKVVEAPRPVAAWDLVLEEMKWMAADFKQERIWKKSAARVSAAAVKEAVADRNARKASEAALLENSLAQRTVARSLAEQVSHFWGNVARLYEYELARKSTIFNTRLISCQLNHVSEIQESLNPPRKRRHDEISSGRSSPDYHEGENGNVTSDDDDSTIEEQEAFELLNSVNENELCELRLDAETKLPYLRDNPAIPACSQSTTTSTTSTTTLAFRTRKTTILTSHTPTLTKCYPSPASWATTTGCNHL